MMVSMKKLWSTFSQHMLPKLALENSQSKSEKWIFSRNKRYRDNKTKVMTAKFFGKRYMYIVSKKSTNVDLSVDQHKKYDFKI